MDENQNPPRLRIIELILVTAVAFAGPIFSAIYELLKGARSQTPDEIRVFVFYGMIYEALAIGVLAYVLFRQGRGFRQLGFAFRWLDIPVSLLLSIASNLAFYICYASLTRGHSHAVAQAEDTARQVRTYLDAGLAVGPVLFVLINPFYEELIVRAYVMTEVKDLTGSVALAVAISVAIQVVYHLYQGVAGAVSLGMGFLVFALYYARSRRIMPIILAHLYLDALALWGSIRH
jgi:membrane protease YdiL (CAAX protease family)